MHFSKFMPLICAAVFCVGSITARAADNPAQASARAALEEKMRELDEQQASTNTSATQPVAVAPSAASVEQQTATPQIPPPDTQPVAPAITVTSSGTSLDTNNLPTVDAIQHSMMPLPTETQAQSPPVTATVTAPGTAPVTAPVTESADTGAQAAARAALAQKMSQLDAQQPVTSVEPPPVVAAVQPPVTVQPTPPAPKPPNVNYPGKQLGLTPIESPAPPVSADKLAKLDALLVKYKADQVSPEEYHKQRAAILAEP